MRAVLTKHMNSNKPNVARRRFVQSAAALGMLDAFGAIAPAYAQTLPGPGGDLRVGGANEADLVIARTPLEFGGQRGTAVTINGTVPGPILRFREGETVTLRVTNRRRLVTRNVTVSPSRKRRIGPGTVPLIVTAVPRCPPNSSGVRAITRSASLAPPTRKSPPGPGSVCA